MRFMETHRPLGSIEVPDQLVQVLRSERLGRALHMASESTSASPGVRPRGGSPVPASEALGRTARCSPSDHAPDPIPAIQPGSERLGVGEVACFSPGRPPREDRRVIVIGSAECSRWQLGNCPVDCVPVAGSGIGERRQGDQGTKWISITLDRRTLSRASGPVEHTVRHWVRITLPAALAGTATLTLASPVGPLVPA